MPTVDYIKLCVERDMKCANSCLHEAVCNRDMKCADSCLKEAVCRWRHEVC